MSNSAGGVCAMEKGICLQRGEEAIVLGLMERNRSSSLSIHTGWVMLGHLLAEVIFQDVFSGLSILNKEFPFLL